MELPARIGNPAGLYDSSTVPERRPNIGFR
jgi:hypothetical protein